MKLSRRFVCICVVSLILSLAIYIYHYSAPEGLIQIQYFNYKIKNLTNNERPGSNNNIENENSALVSSANEQKSNKNETKIQQDLEFERLCDVSSQYGPEPPTLPSKYTLHSIVILIRHGLRAPLSMGKSSFSDDHVISDDGKRRHFGDNKKPSCSLNSKLADTRLIHAIEILKKYIGSTYIPSTLYNSPTYPNSTECQTGQLTAKGARQMYALGSLFNKKYLGLLKTLFKKKREYFVYVRTTYYYRTFQSSMAFLAGFFSNFTYFKDEMNSHKETSSYQSLLQIDTLHNVNHCYNYLNSVKNYCDCPSLKNIEKIFINKTHKLASLSSSTFLNDENESIMNKSKNVIKETFGTLLSYGSVIEIITSFVCYDRDLPCYVTNNSKPQCLTWDKVGIIIKAVKIIEDSSILDSINRFTHCLTGYPLLKEIWDRLNNMTLYKKKGEPLRPIISLYSGHDKTIEPLVSILQIKRDLWLLPLATALTFELYSLKSKKFYVRIIYNGRDVTKEVVFCQTLNKDGLCDFEKMSYFMVKDINDHCFYGNDFSKSCSME